MSRKVCKRVRCCLCEEEIMKWGEHSITRDGWHSLQTYNYIPCVQFICPTCKRRAGKKLPKVLDKNKLYAVVPTVELPTKDGYTTIYVYNDISENEIITFQYGNEIVPTSLSLARLFG